MNMPWNEIFGEEEQKCTEYTSRVNDGFQTAVILPDVIILFNVFFDQSPTCKGEVVE